MTMQEKMNINNGDSFNVNQQSQQQSHLQVLLDSANTSTSFSPSNCHSVKCCDRKICKGIRGLKMHQRTCRVVKDLTEKTFEFAEENLTGSYNNDNYNEDMDNSITTLSLMSNLQSNYQSLMISGTRHIFFHGIATDLWIHLSSIDDSIDLMNSTIYNYFYDNIGYSEDFISDELVNK